MKKIKLLMLILAMLQFSCNKTPKENLSEKIIETQVKVNEAKNQCLPQINNNQSLEKEKLVIYKEEGNQKLEYSKNELNKIEKLFPILNEKIVRDPNETYWFSGVWKECINEKGEKETFSFGSESGQDEFYLLYAYFHKKQNGDDKYKTERRNLVELFRAINGIYERLNYGGTFFGHQHMRLIGQVEYSIYLLDNNKEFYEKKYDFKKQKINYIKSLMQYIEDEESQNIESQINKKEAKERIKIFEQKLDLIQRLATNYFYLNQVQKFEIENYK
jgi:hypothetical protein